MNKIFVKNKEAIFRIFYSALFFLTCALLIILAAGTIFGLVRQQKNPVFTLGSPAGAEPEFAHINDIRVFSGLGRLRIPLVNSSTLLLSIAFPYPANDIAFTEELAVKIGDFRVMAAAYFSALPAESLVQIDEDAAKKEILRLFNNSLRLGRIEALYFNDMMLIE
ncbi:MAG: hypothetical protein FWD40_02010 [Treponema sp.]|nr:hypothetical protein [Treponema sp.]